MSEKKRRVNPVTKEDLLKPSPNELWFMREKKDDRKYIHVTRAEIKNRVRSRIDKEIN